jgi:DNA repair exonuclease SbcCD nuclease subunit
VNLLFWTDLHYSRTPPRSRAPGYGEQVLEKLERVKEVVADESPDLAVFGGDLFHGKDRTTQRETQDVIRALADFPCAVASIWGNHDAGGASQLPFRAYGTVDAALTQFFDVERTNASLGVTGAGYRAGYDTEPGRPAYVPTVNVGGEIAVHVAHGMLILGSSDLPNVGDELTRPEDVEGQTADVVLCGHCHWPQEAREYSGCLYVCPGGLSRVSRAEAGRKVYVAMLTLERRKRGEPRRDVRYVEIPHVEAGDAFLAEDSELSLDAARRAVEDLGSGELFDARTEAERAIRRVAGELSLGEDAVSAAIGYLG